MNPKCLDLLAADGDAAHVPAPEKLEQDQRRHRPVKALPDRRVASVGGIARRPGLDSLDLRVAAARGRIRLTHTVHHVDARSTPATGSHNTTTTQSILLIRDKSPICLDNLLGPQTQKSPVEKESV